MTDYKKGDTFIMHLGNGATREFTVTRDISVSSDLSVRFTAVEPPALQRIIVDTPRYRAAIDAIVKEVAAQLKFAEDVPVFLEPGVEIHIVPRGIA